MHSCWPKEHMWFCEWISVTCLSVVLKPECDIWSGGKKGIFVLCFFFRVAAVKTWLQLASLCKHTAQLEFLFHPGSWGMEENPSCHLNPTCQLCTMAHYMLNHWGKTVTIGWYNLTYPAGRGRTHFVRMHFPRTKQKGCDLYTGIKEHLGVCESGCPLLALPLHAL